MPFRDVLNSARHQPPPWPPPPGLACCGALAGPAGGDENLGGEAILGAARTLRRVEGQILGAPRWRGSDFGTPLPVMVSRFWEKTPRQVTMLKSADLY